MRIFEFHAEYANVPLGKRTQPIIVQDENNIGSIDLSTIYKQIIKLQNEQERLSKEIQDLIDFAEPFLK